jgi:Asp-tRNA(Asn)/Glu-tRNA(Gln) amidotransferase A subunit family amidase
VDRRVAEAWSNMRPDLDLARIEARDSTIHSLMLEPGRAERVARALAMAPDGRLHGVLVGVKDIFHVDGLPTTAGSTLPVEELAGPEAAAVSLLRAAGAVVLGKTVSTEFAFLEPGPTRNPRNLAHTPGGSSSGSAAAVAAGHCPLALGSQTVGSVIRPAAFCGVVGFKPSYGRISTAGMIPLAESFDTVGLLASSVSWVERAAALLCAAWRRRDEDRSAALGTPDGAYLAQASDEALRVLDGLDATRVPLLSDIDALNAAHRRLLTFEMARNHGRWFRRFAERYRPRSAEAIRAGLAVADSDAAAIRARRADVRAAIHEAMDRAGIDLWVCPAAAGPAPEGLASTGDPSPQLPWTHAGLPVLTLPWGTASNGLPLGLQLVARFMDDERLLAWARRLESTRRATAERSPSAVARPATESTAR